MAVSSNSNAGSTETKVGAGALSNFKTENKSNGNFSGGDINLDTSKLSINNPFDTNVPQQPTFNTDDVFKPTLSGNLDIDLPKTNNNSSSNNTTYSNNSNEPTMTVDEVYGKSNNQPVVEKQGDYSASSNEKSKVETSTFGKQDEISVTPTSVTENKGMVGNATIQSVEGLDFQQKDKASVDVLDSKKKRDKVEAEDKADSMRNKLKANVNNAKQQEGGEDFRVGTSEDEKAFNKENARRLAELEKKKKAKEDADNAVLKLADELDADSEKYGDSLEALEETIQESRAINDDYKTNMKSLNPNSPFNLLKDDPEEVAINKLKEVCEKNGIPLPEKIISADDLNDYIEDYCENEKNRLSEEKKLRNENFEKEIERANSEADKASSDLAKAEKDYDNWKKTEKEKLKAGIESTTKSQPETPQSNAETSYNNAIDAINNSTDATPEQKAQAQEAITNLENSRQKLEEAAAKARSGNPAEMAAYQEALEKYNKNLKEAQKIGNIFTQNDFNEKYTRAVMDSKDFKVTLSDGTEMSFSDFMTEEVEKSPQYAKAMYEKRADQLEKDGHPILAKIERMKAKWSQTTLGSKFTFADNKVRNQFYQFTDTNMRATYATLNNVINDKTGKYSDEKKADALKDIEQAKALKGAATALKASTGVLSGADDDVSDGMFGTTDVKSLTDDQRSLASIKIFTQAVLRLGVSPAANKAYQTYYYLNRGDESIFENDLDKDGFTWVEEYGNSAAAGLILSASELGVGVVLLLNPASFANGVDLIADAVTNAKNSLFGVRDSVDELRSMNNEILEYFNKAEQTNGLPEEASEVITNAITQIENFELKSDEVGNLDNWLEGSGSNTASNEKFNQSLSYDEWLKLIEADPTMRDYAKKLVAEKKKKEENAQKDNAYAGVNS